MVMTQHYKVFFIVDVIQYFINSIIYNQGSLREFNVPIALETKRDFSLKYIIFIYFYGTAKRA